ncbi:MAG: MBL fold metallo-hydrolase [bacterium]|nr:MBL fold metallo-hydrolase [bacterium]
MLKFLGTGGAFNIARGNTSAYMEFANELFLFDAGEDVFKKLIQLKLLEKKARVNIFITHLHSDHIGSLGTIIAYLYYKVYNQDNSNICIYFPSEAIVDLLELQGVPQSMYNLFLNKWDELYIPTLGRKQPEYSFFETEHTKNLDYKGACNCYSIEFMLENEFSIFYSGDSNTFHEKLQNIYYYDQIYQEVTMVKEASVHLSYDKLLEATKSLTKEERGRIYLMHLDEDFDEEMARNDGFSIAQAVSL